MMKRLARRAVIALTSMCLAASAYAFSGPEHRRISQTAFDLAVSYARAHGRVFTVAEERVLEALRGNHDESYAGFVVAIDHTVDPLRILERARQEERLPLSRNELDPFIVSSVLDPELAGLRALTINDMHFQAELTTNLRLYHLYAVLLAAQGDAPAPTEEDRGAELFTALVINAISDHLLQDFFAPGHIITPRYGVHDSVALASHEKYNLLGSTFLINRPAFDQDLAPLLEFLPPDSAVTAYRPYVRQRLRTLDSVPLWGDSNLQRSPRQELLLTLLTARSIADVLLSKEGKAVNSFRNVGFMASHRAAPYAPAELVGCHGKDNAGRLRGVHLATASLPYGRYVHPRCYEDDWASAGVINLTVGSEALYQNREVSSRFLVQLDALVTGTTLHEEDDSQGHLFKRPRQKTWALTTGLTYSRNHVQAEQGVNVRALLALPLIHTEFGAQANYRQYGLSRTATHEDARRYSSRLGWIVDGQIGFSVLKFVLGVGRDFGFNRGTLRRATVFRTGAVIEVPNLLIPGTKRLEEWRYLRQRRQQNPDDPLDVEPPPDAKQ